MSILYANESLCFFFVCCKKERETQTHTHTHTHNIHKRAFPSVNLSLSPYFQHQVTNLTFTCVCVCVCVSCIQWTPTPIPSFLPSFNYLRLPSEPLFTSPFPALSLPGCPMCLSYFLSIAVSYLLGSPPTFSSREAKSVPFLPFPSFPFSSLQLMLVTLDPMHTSLSLSLFLSLSLLYVCLSVCMYVWLTPCLSVCLSVWTKNSLYKMYDTANIDRRDDSYKEYVMWLFKILFRKIRTSKVRENFHVNSQKKNNVWCFFFFSIYILL